MFPPHQLSQYEITPEVSYVEKHDLLKDDRSTESHSNPCPP